MSRVVAGLAPVLVVLVAATPPAWGATRRWQVTAVLSGTYANDVTATARCAAHFQERVDGLRMTFRSGTLAYDTQARALTGPLRWTLAGTWRVTGSYVAGAAQPDGAPGCASQPTPVDCSAPVAADDGHRLTTGGSARLAVDDGGAGVLGTSIVGPRLTERFADAGAPPAGWPAACRVRPEDENVLVTPVFGLASTEIADRALAQRIPVPIARLGLRRAFTVRAVRANPTGCPADGFDPCSEQGAFALRVRFMPVGVHGGAR
jgi:hypothetical protein